jgi:hypothetical protein
MMHVNPTIVAVIVIAVLVLVGIVIVVMERRRKATLRQRFGTEYDRAVRERGSEREAQAVLDERAKRVDKFHIRRLDAPERERFATRWRTVQSRFVDDPRGAVIEADDTVAALMGARGYPMADFEQRAADLSVDHFRVVDNYRKAHEIAVRNRQTTASTEDLRQAMIYYRSLFQDLLDEEKPRSIKEVA